MKRHSDTGTAGAGHLQLSSNLRPGASRTTTMRQRWGVILAGGDGTRLQPLTRIACGDDRPKQFCPLLGGKTLLAHTRRRLSKTLDPDRVIFALAKKHEPYYMEELESVPEFQRIVQSHNQGNLPAILWSLMRLVSWENQALVEIFPSDHYFANEDGFISTIERTFDFADKERDSVILLGAEATHPETEYGWIEPEGSTARRLSREFASVQRFWEKPTREIARELLTKGCLWNTFVMIGSAGAFLKMIQQTVPVLFERFEAALLSGESESEEHSMQSIYDSLVPSDFSKQVLAQSAERLLVTSCGDVGWSDLGEPRRFIAALTEDGRKPPRSWECLTDCLAEVTSTDSAPGHSRVRSAPMRIGC